MADEPQQPPSEPKPAPKPRSPQDKKLANDIALAERQIKTALANAEAGPLLADGGFTPDELNNGLGLQRAAFEAFVARQEADGAQVAATRAFKEADKAARKTYTKLRGFARTAVMKDAAARAALGLSGREPTDLQNFLIAAEALVTQGAKPEFATLLAKKTVTAAKLEDLKTKLDALKAADQAQEAAKSAVPKATQARDDAAKVLFEWLSGYEAFVRMQFQDRPDIAKRLML
jgi:hypothetical protein